MKMTHNLVLFSIVSVTVNKYYILSDESRMTFYKTPFAQSPRAKSFNLSPHSVTDVIGPISDLWWILVQILNKIKRNQFTKFVENLFQFADRIF